MSFFQIQTPSNDFADRFVEWLLILAVRAVRGIVLGALTAYMLASWHNADLNYIFGGIAVAVLATIGGTARLTGIFVFFVFALYMIPHATVSAFLARLMG